MSRFAAFLLTLASLFTGAPLVAHPMGNFSINHYTRLRIERHSVDILYIIDMAEIPAYQEIRQNGLAPGTENTGLEAYAKAESAALARGLALQIGGRPLTLIPATRDASFVPGAGGLPTLRIKLNFRAKLDSSAAPEELAYFDNNFANRAGWKEIVVQAGAGVAFQQSSATATDRSSELTVYAADLLTTPPQDVTATVAFTRAAPVTITAQKIVAPRVSAVAITAPRVADAPVAKPAASPVVLAAKPTASTPRSAFTQLITSEAPLGFVFLLSAALIAAALGALHALEPGHGKTIVASYLVGSHGSARHAVLLGVVVTLSHTAGVFALGLITLYAAQYIVPDRLYPILGAISGLSVVAVGTLIFVRTMSGETGDHSHTPGESHSHWLQSLTKAPALSSERKSGGPISLRQLLILGITGGIIPCPGALVVLLSAFSLHRIGFGLFLIVAFSAGLAAVLISIGLFVVYAKRFALSRFRVPGVLSRYLPLGSSLFMTIAGAAIVYSSLQPLLPHWSGISREHLVPFVAVVLLGLFLGMRHSTDSDHVVAVSTLVSRQGSIRSSVSIGLLWGLGHTITIFLVGTAIIVFGFVIPPRLGLSMEFAVALMLVALGILNLTGALGKITARFSPAPIASVRLAADNPGRLGLFHSLRPLVIGLVHGLAGSAAVALLVLSTIRNPFWACGYLLVFGFGTMLGMMLMTCAISIPLVYAQAKSARVTTHLTTLSGFASLAFGLFLVIQIGFVDGLFRSQVHWVAH